MIEIYSTEANEMLQHDKNFIVLDVRTADEFRDGQLQGAINIDIREPDAFDRIDKLDKTAKYIVHCRTNVRSETAAVYMMQNGFKNTGKAAHNFLLQLFSC